MPSGKRHSTIWNNKLFPSKWHQYSEQYHWFRKMMMLTPPPISPQAWASACLVLLLPGKLGLFIPWLCLADETGTILLAFLQGIYLVCLPSPTVCGPPSLSSDSSICIPVEDDSWPVILVFGFVASSGASRVALAMMKEYWGVLECEGSFSER